MSEVKKTIKRKAEPIGLRCIHHEEGSHEIRFYPASASDKERIKSKKVGHGELVFVDFRKPRSPGFHRLAHAIGTLAVENIPGFEHLTSHEALKRLQVEAGVGCETIQADVGAILPQTLEWIENNLSKAHADVLRMSLADHRANLTKIPVLIPRSMSYDSMDQGEFFEAIRGICKYMAVRYWPGCSPQEIEDMAQAMSGDLKP